LECVFRFCREFGRGAKKLHESFAGGLACPLFEKSAAVSTTPTFSATAAAIHWFNDTPSSFASRWAA
jgi:hypothetical protein